MAHILIIDDDASILELFGQFFELEGFSTDRAANGRDGLAALKKNTPDLIITDIMMPEMDGLEILQEVRKTHSDIPVFAISGGMRSAPLNFLPHAEKLGACRIFHKPVAIADLLSAVKETLGEE